MLIAYFTIFSDTPKVAKPSTMDLSFKVIYSISGVKAIDTAANPSKVANISKGIFYGTEKKYTELSLKGRHGYGIIYVQNGKEVFLCLFMISLYQEER